jgi:hypothetical protein
MLQDGQQKAVRALLETTQTLWWCASGESTSGDAKVHAAAAIE